MLAGQKLWFHAYQPISHSYLKNLSCYSPNWHTFKKYVSKNHNRERKVHIRDSTLFTILQFLRESTGLGIMFGKIHPGSGTRKCSKCLRKSLDHPRKSLDVFRYVWVFENPDTPSIIIWYLWLGKRLLPIYPLWHIASFLWSFELPTQR